MPNNNHVGTLDRTSPVPLHHQLKQYLHEQILRGHWKPNDLIPSEQELQEQFGLSRITVRRALSDLVNEGLLVRERGRGTFVAPPKLTHSPQGRRSLTDSMLQQGIQPGWQILDRGFVEASSEVAEQLAVPAGSRVYCIRRLRLADDQPIGVHTAYLRGDLADAVDEAALREGGSLHYLSRLPQMISARATRIIEAVAATEVEARLLHVMPGSPILQITRVVADSQGRPIEYLQARYRGDRFKYQIGD
jgi:GntR family transcriptional regulator